MLDQIVKITLPESAEHMQCVHLFYLKLFGMGISDLVEGLLIEMSDVVKAQILEATSLTPVVKKRLQCTVW